MGVNCQFRNPTPKRVGVGSWELWSWELAAVEFKHGT
jgi:hypothetical protein